MQTASTLPPPPCVPQSPESSSTDVDEEQRRQKKELRAQHTSSVTAAISSLNEAPQNKNNGEDDDDASRTETRCSQWKAWNKECILPFRQNVGLFVNHSITQTVVILLIAINALMLGLETCPFVKDNPEVERVFQLTDDSFLILFTVELGMQLVYLGLRRLLRDPWLVFDLVLISTSWIFQDFTIIRSFRIFRALRLITRIKVMRDLITALFSVVPRMFAIFLLLTLISYIFAVMMTQLWRDMYVSSTDAETDYFGRIDATYFTLFQIMTLDGWAEICREVMAVYSYAWIPIITYVIITGFVVVNLVIAVICDAVSALQEDTKAKLHGNYQSQHFPGEATEADLDPTEWQDSTRGTVIAKEPLVEMQEQLSTLDLQVKELMLLQEETLQTVLRCTQRFQQS
jgi:Ion transport protein